MEVQQRAKGLETAREMFDRMLNENDGCTSTEMMKAYAEQAIDLALTMASEKAIEAVRLNIMYLNNEMVSIQPTRERILSIKQQVLKQLEK